MTRLSSECWVQPFILKRGLCRQQVHLRGYSLGLLFVHSSKVFPTQLREILHCSPVLLHSTALYCIVCYTIVYNYIYIILRCVIHYKLTMPSNIWWLRRYFQELMNLCIYLNKWDSVLVSVYVMILPLTSILDKIHSTVWILPNFGSSFKLSLITAWAWIPPEPIYCSEWAQVVIRLRR